MKKVVHPAGRRTPSSSGYHRFLRFLSRIKVIPIVEEQSSSSYSFRVISLPSLLSTLWAWVPLAYYLYRKLAWPLAVNIHAGPTVANVSSTSNPATTTTSSSTDTPLNRVDAYINVAFLVDIFLLILLLPAVLGHFFATNGLAAVNLEKRFVWPRRGWMVVLSAAIFIATETTTLCSTVVQSLAQGVSTEGLVHYFASLQLLNLIVALLQLIALLLVSAEQTDFMQTAAAAGSSSSSERLTKQAIQQLLQAYEDIRQGISHCL